MRKVYYVTIKGRTLESRDIKELLARAVTVKRKMNECDVPAAVYAHSLCKEVKSPLHSMN